MKAFKWTLLVFAFAALVGVVHAQNTTRNGLTVTLPNGYANLTAYDLQVQTTAGAVKWARVWNGKEWQFNPQWESLSQTWVNPTGSKTADATRQPPTAPSSADTTVVTSLPAGNSGTPLGGNDGCWVWVDEDWSPTKTVSNGVPVAAALLPLRSTLFNRLLISEQDTYAPAALANFDYMTLCSGFSSSGMVAVQSQEAIRRGNELYVGENGRYAFTNRYVIEKRGTRRLPPTVAATLKASLGTGSLALAPVSNGKGYRRFDRGGGWMDFSSQGQLVAWGDRNNNVVWLARDLDGIVHGAVDANGRVVFTLHYTGDFLTEVRDYATGPTDLPARSVKYQYDGNNRISQVTDVRGNTIKYGYDAGNNLTSITDQEGRVEQLIYSGNLVSQRTAPDGGKTDYEFDYDEVNKQFTSRLTGPETTAGRRVDSYTHNRVGQLVQHLVNGRADETVRYDTGARMESHTNARGFTTNITRNEFDQVIQVQQADATFVAASYSALHLQMVDQTDEAGTKTLFGRDNAGNLLKTTLAAGLPEQRITEYTVNALGQTTQVNRKGRVEADGSITTDAITQIGYDALGQVTSITDAEGKTRQYRYDRAGSLISQTDPLNNSTRYTSDAAGNLTRVVDALGRNYSFVYDMVGNLTSLTDARGKTTLAAYDSMNRLTQSTNAVGGVYKRQHDAMGQVVNEVDEDGVQRRAQFDSFQRLTQITDGLGNLTKYSYTIADGSDAGGLGSLTGPTQIQYPTFTQNQHYDQRERPTANALLNPAAQGLQTLTGASVYDRIGRLTQTTDANGKQRTRGYDALRQATSFIDALGAKTQLQYDARGNLLSLTDALSHTYKFTYDRNDRVTAEILPLGQRTTYQYDANGNLTQRNDPNKNKAVYTYDQADRLKTIQRYDAQGTQVRDTSYTWDESNNLTSWSDSDLTRPADQQTSSAVAIFDDANRKTRETTNYPNPAGGSIQMSTGYGYSQAGRKTTLLWPDGTEIGYGYSAHGVLQSVTIPGEGTLSVSSYHWMAPAKITLPGGTTQEQTYDGLLKQQSLTVKGPTQQLILQLDNRYGNVQELSSKVRTDADSTGSSTTTTTGYAYDDEVRLREARTQTKTGSPEVEVFALDAVANRTRHSRTGGAWTYDANNRLLQSGTGLNSATYEWDDAGNQIAKVEANGKAWKYVYDTQNRLSEVRDGGNNLVARYGFDPMNRRLWKEVFYNASGRVISLPVRLYFVYSEEGLVGVAEQPLASVGGLDAAGVAQNILAIGVRPNAEFSTGPLFIRAKADQGRAKFYYYHRDHLNAVQLISDSTGKSNAVVKNGSFGDFNQGADLFALLYLLPGQLGDLETGNIYNAYRNYEPTTGRYMQRDPIGLGGGLNQYAYVNGDPVNRMDPLGLFDLGLLRTGHHDDSAKTCPTIEPDLDNEECDGTWKREKQWGEELFHDGGHNYKEIRKPGQRYTAECTYRDGVLTEGGFYDGSANAYEDDDWRHVVWDRGGILAWAAEGVARNNFKPRTILFRTAFGLGKAVGRHYLGPAYVYASTGFDRNATIEILAAGMR